MDPIGLGVSLLGGLMGSSSASSAAAQQAAAAREAEQGIQKRFDITRQDYAPFMQTGYGANSILAHLMGIRPTATAASNPQSAEALRKQLIGQFTTKGPEQVIGWNNQFGEGAPIYGYGKDTIDEAGLQAAINAELAKQTPQNSGYDPSTFGSLLKDFSESDIYADPVFKMAQSEAANAVNERAMRSGMYNSGGTLKELMKANSQVGTDAFNRWNVQQGNKYNRLSGLMGAGQQAVSQVGNLGAQAANQSGEYMTQGGNARAAGIVGGANAWGNALGQWNQNQQHQSNQDFLKGLYGGSNWNIPSTWSA